MTSFPAPPHSYTTGSIRAAWSYRAFRLIWIGQALSNVGTWMQNVALPAYVQDRWDSGTLVGVMVFAQLGPILFLSIPGSVAANRLPRKPWLITMPSIQLVAALCLAALVASDAPFWTLFAANAVMGAANALNGPAFQASIPLLVDRRDIPGAISLNSAQLNGSRVVGPLIAGALTLTGVTVSQLLVINAATYPFIIAAIAVVEIPVVRGTVEQGFRQLTTGLRIARGRPVLTRLLLTMMLFSLASLAFVGLFATVATLAFGMEPRSAGYSWLYAVFGLGALTGGLAGGTVFARVDKRRLIRPAFLAFAVSELVFGLLRSPGPAYVFAFALGTSYLLVTTSMSIVFQQSMADDERTFLMALWFMAFAGTVPVGNLIFGPVMDSIGPRWVLAFGAAMAVFLAWWCDIPRLERTGRLPAGDEGSHALERGHPAPLDEHGATRTN